MTKLPREQENTPTIRDLYPHLDEAQLEKAEENFQRYLDIALRIYERVKSVEVVVDNQRFDGLK